MSLHESFRPSDVFRAPLSTIDADRAMKFGVGAAATPLWAAYFTAASAGVAFWWMTAWTRQEPKSFALAFEPAAEPEVEAAPVAALEVSVAEVAAPEVAAPEVVVPEVIAAEIVEAAHVLEAVVDTVIETVEAAAETAEPIAALVVEPEPTPVVEAAPVEAALVEAPAAEAPPVAAPPVADLAAIAPTVAPAPAKPAASAQPRPAATRTSKPRRRR